MAEANAARDPESTAEPKRKAKREPGVVHATCVVERSFSQPRDVVFRALSEPEKVRRWMGPGEHSALTKFTLDFREGGLQLLAYRMGDKTPLPGVVITNEARFVCVVPDERIVTASTMKRGDWIFSASLATFELLSSEKGTDLVITHQGAFFEGADGPAMRSQGWNILADKLVELVEAEAPEKA